MRNLSNGYFITLEGIEGSGKTSQASYMIDLFTSLSLPFISTREPGGTPIAGEIRKILVESHDEQLDGLTELFLYNAARIQHLKELIRPALAQGKIVVCDRYVDATIAYQAYGRGLPLDQVVQINQWATESLMPDLTLLFDCDPKLGLKRSWDRLHHESSNEDRFESESLDFHTRVREGYLEIAETNPKRFVVIDARQSPAEVSDAIHTILTERLKL
jgi:dTMP kinase